MTTMIHLQENCYFVTKNLPLTRPRVRFHESLPAETTRGPWSGKVTILDKKQAVYFCEFFPIRQVLVVNLFPRTFLHLMEQRRYDCTT